MQGHVVISLGLFGHADQPTGAKFLTSDGNEQAKEKQQLDQLHFRKIEMSDAIFVINVGGYVGSSTKKEIAYAQSLGKEVEYMFIVPVNHPPHAPVAMSNAYRTGWDDFYRGKDICTFPESRPDLWEQWKRGFEAAERADKEPI